MKINLLEPNIYNRISAGEVVENPASIVKELLENSIDAGATAISVSIENGGIGKIEVADNGSGIEKDDLFLAFTPHATSKIKTLDDLDAISSLGFRGEALASIASVCHVNLSSKQKESDIGYALNVDGGKFGQIQEVARTNGTTLVCRDLFFNTPARAKFLKRPKIEEGNVTHLIEKFMLSHPEIAFSYIVDGKQVYHTSDSVMQDIIYTIYGREVYDALIPIDYVEDGIRLSGFVTKPKISKSNRTYQTLFVNGRYVENYLVSQAVQGVYESFLMKGRFPIFVLKLDVPVDSVDVNVHPSKKEVKFSNPNKIFGLVRRAVEKALLSVDQIATYVSQENFTTQGEVELSSEFNKEGFNPILKPNDALSQYEGSSYRKVDRNPEASPVAERELRVGNNSKINELEKHVTPQFKNITLPNKDDELNKLGGPFFFDQAKSNTLGQIIADDNKQVVNKSFLNSSVVDEMRILGTVFKTYIAVECANSLYFIDQHAAHERLLYDKLIKKVDGNDAKQSLLVPYSFTLGPKEAETLEQCFQALKEIGFEIECKGFNYVISAVPLVLHQINLSDFVDELVKESINFERKPSAFIHDRLCQSACKHAIKAGDEITKDECAYLIEQIRKGVMLCPHGRPIVLELTRHEFEKLFKRIV